MAVNDQQPAPPIPPRVPLMHPKQQGPLLKMIGKMLKPHLPKMKMPKHTHRVSRPAKFKKVKYY